MEDHIRTWFDYFVSTKLEKTLWYHCECHWIYVLYVNAPIRYKMTHSPVCESFCVFHEACLMICLSESDDSALSVNGFKQKKQKNFAPVH